MPKRKTVETSLEAYRNLDPIRLTQIQQDIVRALKAIGEGNYEAIAAFLMEKPERIWKRLNEVERKGAIYKPGHTVITKNGAKSYVYRATENGEVSYTPERFPKGPASSDYAKQIIQQSMF